MALAVIRATGRAKCRLCNQLIDKNEIDIIFSGYQSEKHYHKKCIDSEANKLEEDKICLQCYHFQSSHTKKGCVIINCGCRVVNIQHKTT